MNYTIVCHNPGKTISLKSLLLVHHFRNSLALSLFPSWTMPGLVFPAVCSWVPEHCLRKEAMIWRQNTPACLCSKAAHLCLPHSFSITLSKVHNHAVREALSWAPSTFFLSLQIVPLTSIFTLPFLDVYITLCLSLHSFWLSPASLPSSAAPDSPEVLLLKNPALLSSIVSLFPPNFCLLSNQLAEFIDHDPQVPNPKAYF